MAAAAPVKVAKTEVKKKRKIVGDPELAGIKKPLSAYMIYNVTRGPVIRRENPEISITEVSKLIGEEWRNLTDG